MEGRGEKEERTSQKYKDFFTPIKMVKILKILSISNAGETAKKVHHSYIVEI
jgi:hypothetical protein